LHHLRSVAVVFLWASLQAGTAAAQDRPLRIGIVTGQIGSGSADSFAPFTNYLSSRIAGSRFEIVQLATIEELLRAGKEGRIEFAFCTPAALVELDVRYGVRTIATITQPIAGGAAYPWLAGAVFVRRDRTDIQTLTDVRGKRVVALSPLALGGWLAAVREWRRLGINEQADFQSLRFAFSYAMVASEVCSGSADAGVLSAATLSDMARSCPAGFRVLQNPRGGVDPRYPTAVSTPLYPEAGVAVLGNVDERLVSQLTRELLSVESGSDAAKAVAAAGFSAPLSYASVQELMKELRISPYEAYGRLTFAEAVRQHAGKVLLGLTGFLLILAAGFTRTHRLNTQLAASEGFRKRVFEGSVLPIVVMDATSLRFIDCNPAATEIYRFASRAATLENTLFDVSAPAQYDGEASREKIRAQIDRALAERLIVFEWRHQRPDGELWDAEVHLMSFRADNRPLLQFWLQDVTERKRLAGERQHLEEQLQHAQRMDSIGRLAGAVAHDFNNLLTVINGYSEMLLGMTDETHPQWRSVVQIKRAGERATELTHQLLTFSRKQVTQPIRLDLNTVIRESETMFRRLIGEDIQMRMSLREELWPSMADLGQMHQVLMNLVLNARDAMPAGGLVTIATDNVEVRPDQADRPPSIPDGEYVVFEVSDTGIGMDAETRQHIFEPFFTTKGEAGTGIGLSTVYGIVKQSHGGITVWSQPGQGTTLKIYLPRAARLVEPVPVATIEPAAAPGSHRVLLVEDQEDVRAFARDALEFAGYQVLEAASGDAALALAASHRAAIHLLLTDVVLGGMNGRELSERLTRIHPETKTLFTSGYADDITARRGVLSGRMAFLPKPYSGTALRAKVSDILRTSASPA
jgi:signal transduction histidine kinase/ABC-type phosphate/phosphonate transport system substrate-binding protein